MTIEITVEEAMHLWDATYLESGTRRGMTKLVRTISNLDDAITKYEGTYTGNCLNQFKDLMAKHGV